MLIAFSDIPIILEYYGRVVRGWLYLYTYLIDFTCQEMQRLASISRKNRCGACSFLKKDSKDMEPLQPDPLPCMRVHAFRF